MNIQEALQEVVKYHAQRNLKDAEIRCRQILEVAPDQPDAHHFLGVIAYEVNNLPAAAEYLEKAIQLNPNNPGCYLNMGNVLFAAGQLEDAIVWHEKAITFDGPNKPKAFNNIGVVLTRLGRLEEARQSIQKAIDANPQYFEAHNNISEVYRKTGEYDAAMASVEAAIALAPEFVSARWNRAILLLLKGDLKNGLPEYEWRWKRAETPNRAIDAGEKWQGQPFPEKTIFIWEEQGLGDTIQFMRYLPMVKQLGGHVIFEVVPPLVRLVESASGFDRLLVGQKNVDTRPVDRFDYHFPLMSLPMLFNTTLETIPAPQSYLKADPELVRIWQKRIGAEDRFKIGIVWAGHPGHNNDMNRSVHLSRFAALKKIDGISLYSLQKEKYPGWTDMDPDEIFTRDLGCEISDFADTAAAVENLDLVISVDTAVVHLAGALGKEVWTLLPCAVDWRWMTDREDSPWYPAMKLFRQSSHGEWDPVFENVCSALQKKMHPS